MYLYAAGIELAAKDGIDWILHIDTDELVYPGGGAEYSIQRVLASVPSDVDTLVFPNYESLPERDDVQDPFTEVRHSYKQPYSQSTVLAMVFVPDTDQRLSDVRRDIVQSPTGAFVQAST